MLPILVDDLGKIEGAGVITAGILVHNTAKIKGRVTYDCIREGPSQQSINSICVEE